MADVFISYKSERRNAAQHLKRILELHGYTVWFDYALLTGRDFARQIETELTAAKAVVVLWCSRSVQSEWVINEAYYAKEHAKFIPVWIEQTTLPFGFQRDDTINLTEWDASPRSPDLDRLLDQIAHLVARDPMPDMKGLRDHESNWKMFGAPSLATFALDSDLETERARREEEERQRKAEDDIRLRAEEDRQRVATQNRKEAEEQELLVVVEKQRLELESSANIVKKLINKAWPMAVVLGAGTIAAVSGAWMMRDTINSTPSPAGAVSTLPAATEIPIVKAEPRQPLLITQPTTVTSVSLIPPMPVNLKGVSDQQWRDANNGNADSQHAIGAVYRDGLSGTPVNSERAEFWFLKASEQNLPVALFDLANLYSIGAQGVAINGRKAEQLYLKASEQNYKPALLGLGALYLYGADGIEKDGKKSEKWFSIAAEHKLPAAQYGLGLLYLVGAPSVDPNGKKAEEWLLKSAEQKYALAQANLGALYLDGAIGVQKDSKKAEEWLLKAADQGAVFAQRKLGKLYQDGSSGFPINGPKAEEWLLKAANQGDIEAQFLVGFLYDDGSVGINKDGRKAEEWYLKSATRGHLNSQINLAYLYEGGAPNLPKNFTAAIVWYKKSVDNGHKDSIVALKRLGVKYP